MPLFEEKFICPFAIRFSQARIRPTFQDGRVVEDTLHQIEAMPWPLEDSDRYDMVIDVPFPPIEIIRWWPKMRDKDGMSVCDEDGNILMGEACWFTFDNRRLYCLQAAAAKHWPLKIAAVVHVMRDLPISRGTPRKFRTTNNGNSVNISRRYDPVPRAVWNWTEATGCSHPQGAAEKAAVQLCTADAEKEDYWALLDVPNDIFKNRPVRSGWGEAPPAREARDPARERRPQGAREQRKAAAPVSREQPRQQTVRQENPDDEDVDDDMIRIRTQPHTKESGGGLTVAELAARLNGNAAASLGSRAVPNGMGAPWTAQANPSHSAAVAGQSGYPFGGAGQWTSDLEAQRWALASALANPAMVSPHVAAAHMQRHRQLEASLQYRAAATAAQAAAFSAANQQALARALASARAEEAALEAMTTRPMTAGISTTSSPAAPKAAASPKKAAAFAPAQQRCGLGVFAPAAHGGLDPAPLVHLDRAAALNGGAGTWLDGSAADIDGSKAAAGAAACGVDRAALAAGGEADADCTTE